MSVFRFKQFVVNQDGVAMKVNTDGVLLGAWVSLPENGGALQILDIGTGSGVIALMLAQRLAGADLLDGCIHALEPHSGSAQAASANFAESPWASRLRLFEHTLQHYASEEKNSGRYDLIVANPPYFEDALRPPVQERCLVRHTDSLSYSDLLKGVEVLLRCSGRFGVILPIESREHFCTLAEGSGLFLCRETILYTLAGRTPKRILMEFVKQKEPLKSDSLTIHLVDGESFSPEYRQLTKDFYLAF